MRSIRSRDTRPELIFRRWLRANGFGYRLELAELPFKPDVILSRYKLVVFIHGCFWHRHSGCFYATTPADNYQKWQKKFLDNEDRDRRSIAALRGLGWRVLVIWECGLKHCQDDLPGIIGMIKGDQSVMEWPSRPPRLR